MKKKLKLTEVQKSRLLEMCNKLFPEYDVRLTYQLHNRKDLFIQFGKKESDKYEFEFHWFEFCMGDLTNKLYKLFFTAMGEENILWDLLVKESFYTQVLHHKTLHPVDYLYENFKKL
jgi:hypothetical protein